MKKLLLPTIICLLISGCNSGGGSSEPAVSIPVDENNTGGTDTNTDTDTGGEDIADDTVNPNGFTVSEIREDWNIPPLPTPDNPDYNTIKGVDDYGVEGARDDWEVKNAFATYPDKREFDILNKAAVNNTKMIDAYESGDDEKLKELFEEYIWTLTCHGYYYYDDDKNINLLNSPAKNTEDREKNKEDILYRIEVLLTSNVAFPTELESREKCPTFIIPRGYYED
tara:strand:+ start:2783 stop:3457 length:675 start_codon:yes stop_codon:yes gene_type:complete